MNPQASSSSSGKMHPQQRQPQQPGTSSSMNMNVQRDRNHRMSSSNSGSSAATNYPPGSTSMKVPGQQQQRPSVQNMNPDGHNKNRINHPGSNPQQQQQQQVSGSMQKHLDHINEMKIAASEARRMHQKKYPISANSQEFSQRSSSSSSSTNKLPYPQSSSRPSSQQSATSVPMENSSKQSFSLIDDSSDLMESISQPASKKPPTSIFDPDYTDPLEDLLKTMKPNKDSPSKDKLRREQKTPSKRPPSITDNQPIQSHSQNQKRPHMPNTSMPSRDAIEAAKVLQQQQRHGKPVVTNPSLFASMKRPLDKSGSTQQESKKPKFSNSFYEDDFDKIYAKDIQFGKNESNLFGAGNNGNNNSRDNSQGSSTQNHNQNSRDFSGILNENTNSSSSQSQFEKKKEVEVKKEILSTVVAKEANPDFVKCLLQEAFPSNDKLSLVKPDLMSNSITDIPLELPDYFMAEPTVKQEPSLPVSLLIPINHETASSLPSNSLLSSIMMQQEDHNSQSGGSEHRLKKKKKKEKHKKDRSKDREAPSGGSEHRHKKHKKEKHKSKESSHENSLKVKLNFSSDDQTPKSPIRITIPKIPPPIDQPLKITISREKIKGYEGHISSSHKKKDKDRHKSKDSSKPAKLPQEFGAKFNGAANEFGRFNNPANATQTQTQSHNPQQVSQQQPVDPNFYDFSQMYNPGIGGQLNKVSFDTDFINPSELFHVSSDDPPLSLNASRDFLLTY